MNSKSLSYQPSMYHGAKFSSQFVLFYWDCCLRYEFLLESSSLKRTFSYSNSSKTTIIKKLCKSKNLSNHRVVILKNPLQVTCDLQRVFQHEHFFFLSILKNLFKPLKNTSVIWQVFWYAKLCNVGGLTTIAIWEWTYLTFQAISEDSETTTLLERKI